MGGSGPRSLVGEFQGSKLVRSYGFFRGTSEQWRYFKIRHTSHPGEREKNTIPRSESERGEGGRIIPVLTLHAHRGKRAKSSHCGDEALEADPPWVSTSLVLTGFSPSVLVLVSNLAPPRSSASSKASALASTPPIRYWSRTYDLAGAGDSNSGSVPAPVFGNAITSRIDGVLHSIDINLSNPVYGIVFGLRFEFVQCACAWSVCVSFENEMIRRGPPNGRARIFGSARLFAGSWVRDCRGVGKLGQHGKRFSQQIVR